MAARMGFSFLLVQRLCPLLQTLLLTLPQELFLSERSEGPERAWTWQGIHFLNAADCVLTSLNFSTTVSTAVPKTRASRRKFLSFSPVSKFSHSCLSTATTAAIERQMAWAVCVVVPRARSVAASILCPGLLGRTKKLTSHADLTQLRRQDRSLQ